VLGRGDYWGERGQSSADVNSTKNRQAETNPDHIDPDPVHMGSVCSQFGHLA